MKETGSGLQMNRVSPSTTEGAVTVGLEGGWGKERGGESLLGTESVFPLFGTICFSEVLFKAVLQAQPTAQVLTEGVGTKPDLDPMWVVVTNG